MKLQIKIILAFLLLIIANTISAQTPGFNYQALILNSSEIEIPGTNVQPGKIPLGLEDIILRFTITNTNGIEYTEEHTLTTDENGMVSVIVGEGTPTNYTFENIRWDGKIKYLDVELNILNKNEDFVFLDTQKILYLPNRTKLAVVINNAQRYLDFINPEAGDAVWNESCNCIQIFNGLIWVSKISNGVNGLTKAKGTLELGGTLIKPTEITTNTVNTFALKGLQISTNENDQIIVLDRITGVLKQKPTSDVIRQEQVVVKATDGQLRFTTPHPITNAGKIQVFRNGAIIAFTLINTTTIEIELEAICYKNDEIRIVQLY